MNKTATAAIIIFAATFITAAPLVPARAAGQNQLLEAFIDATKASLYSSQLATSYTAAAVDKKQITQKDAKHLNAVQRDLLALISWQLDKTLEIPDLDSQYRESLQQLSSCLLDLDLALGTLDTYISKPTPELSKSLNKKLDAARQCSQALLGLKE